MGILCFLNGEISLSLNHPLPFPTTEPKEKDELMPLFLTGNPVNHGERTCGAPLLLRRPLPLPLPLPLPIPPTNRGAPRAVRKVGPVRRTRWPHRSIRLPKAAGCGRDPTDPSLGALRSNTDPGVMVESEIRAWFWRWLVFRVVMGNLT